MMRKWILAIVLLALLVVPVMAEYTDNFQDYSADGWVYTGAAAPTVTASAELITLTTVAGDQYWETAYPSNYFAYFTGLRVPVKLYDPLGNAMGTYTPGDNYRLVEIIRDSTTGLTTVWENGSFYYKVQNGVGPNACVAGICPIAPSHLVFSGGLGVIDNFHTGDSNPRYWTSTLPPNWTVVRDFINPANSGLYATHPVTGAQTLIRTTYMDSTWSRGNSTSNTTVSLKNVATGTAYETLGMTPGWFGTTRNNLSVLTAGTSTAPNGLYEITQDSGSGTDNHAYFWFTSTGATIAWDMDKYYSDETSKITWSITPAYWDTVTYSYEGAIVDVYGTSKKTWTITAASGSESTTLDTTNYPQGVYFTKLTATQKASPFTAYILDTDNTEVSQDIKLSGITYNATTNATFPKIFINFTQTGVGIVNTTSNQITGAYNKTGFSTGSAIVIEPNNNIGSHEPLMWTPISFTPLSYGNFTINLYGTETLLNASKTHGNSTIYGLVQSSPYYNALPGATVRIWNATQYTSFYTNATGYYNFTGLLPFTEYNMNASYTGYTTSDDVVVNASTVFGGTLYNVTRKDFLLSTMYTMTITFKDATSGAVIPVVTVVDSNGYSATTTAGTFTYTYPYSLVAFYFSATGYTGSSSSYIMDSDRSVTIYLTAAATPPDQTMFNSPHQVKWQVVDKYGNRQAEVDVNATPVSTTIPNNSNWLLTMFGLGSTTTPVINATSLYGTTDSAGAIVFTQIGSINYEMNFTKASAGIDHKINIMPIESQYTIWVSTTDTATAPNCGLLINASLFPTVYTTAETWLNLTVTDAGNSLYNTSYFIDFPNMTRFYTKQFMGTAPYNQSFNASYNVVNTAGEMYVWGAFINSSVCGNLSVSQGITMKGDPNVRFFSLDPCGGYAKSWGGDC